MVYRRQQRQRRCNSRAGRNVPRRPLAAKEICGRLSVWPVQAARLHECAAKTKGAIGCNRVKLLVAGREGTAWFLPRPIHPKICHISKSVALRRKEEMWIMEANLSIPIAITLLCGGNLAGVSPPRYCPMRFWRGASPLGSNQISFVAFVCFCLILKSLQKITKATKMKFPALENCPTALGHISARISGSVRGIGMAIRRGTCYCIWDNADAG
jgi:hypothetical protein